jgi:hypothetical protein
MLAQRIQLQGEPFTIVRVDEMAQRPADELPRIEA